MNRRLFTFPAPLLVTIMAIGLAAAVSKAQAPPADQPPGAGQPTSDADQPKSDKEWLAKAGNIYYSSAKAGLTGFDCAVHPDWHTLLASANNGQVAPENEQRIALLNTVKITLHARMHGGSTIEWVADSSVDKPQDEGSTDLLESMHQSVEHTLEGFLQFWGPFMEATVVPDSVVGLEITHSPSGHKIHAQEGDTELTEVFSPDLVLQQFNVNMRGMSIKFSPTYKPTPQGLLVNAFEAHIHPTGASSEQEQVMKVGIEYQPVNGLMIPARLNMDVARTGTFNFTFDGCTTNPK